MLNLCKEYCKNSSVHGLELVVSERNSLKERFDSKISQECLIKERFFWGCLIGVATVLLAQNVFMLGIMVTHSNVELIVDNPNYNLENVDFPAVTICSNSKLMKTRVLRYINYLRNNHPQFTSQDAEKFINSILALDLMQFPFLHHPNLFKESFNNNVFPIPNEEIFDVMLAVKPRLADMIKDCKWRGRLMRCKSLFRKQITEEGFCYSFNSKTADRSSDDFPQLPPEEQPDGSLECLRNNAAGRGSGLSFSLKSLDQESFTHSMQTRGYSVSVHNPNAYPDISHKYMVFWKNYTFSRISVLVTTTKTDKSFSRITETARGCEMSNKMGTSRSCLLKCRQKEILKQCGCLPYYMYHLDRYAMTCGIQHFKCLEIHNKRLRNPHINREKYKIPKWSEPLYMNCTCKLPCSTTKYTTEYSFIPREEVVGKIGHTGVLGFVEVVYKTNYATSYIRRAHFTFSDFLVDVGALAGLFLGCSVITVVELSIFLYKLVNEAYFILFIKRTIIQPFVK